jgi:lipopolysaccharide transport system ATP-binding protein
MIQVKDLGKQYRLGQFVGSGQVNTLRDAISRSARGVVRRFSGREFFEGRNPELIWALQDISFELKRGEVLGIIGRNGAGKTTLLKILSRITEPTTGRVVLRGRVASLLEVGTGFHPELTGRENVFLNGVVLGMRRIEIKEKFDEIVEFAGVERFIDTPVKRFSSGMQLRLAFAVAAHLDPEILIIDEVLAVGDASFQMKCLRKMESVSRDEGRTILFVSHNMGVIRTLCSRALLFEEGRLVGQGDLDELIARYLGTTDDSAAVTDLSIRTDRAGDGSARILRSGIFDLEGRELSTVLSGQDIRINFSHTAPDSKGRQQ